MINWTTCCKYFSKFEGDTIIEDQGTSHTYTATMGSSMGTITLQQTAHSTADQEMDSTDSLKVWNPSIAARNGIKQWDISVWWR